MSKWHVYVVCRNNMTFDGKMETSEKVEDYWMGWWRWEQSEEEEERRIWKQRRSGWIRLIAPSVA